MKNADKKSLPAKQKEELVSALKQRFQKNISRHRATEWADVEARLISKQGEAKLWSLQEMENSGGEPDVVGQDKKSGEYIFMIVRRKLPRAAEVYVTIKKV